MQNDNLQATETNYVSQSRKELKNGLLWGGIICAICTAIFFTSYFLKPSSESLIGAIILSVCSFTFSSQMFWAGHIVDIFFFFCRSFAWPFGFIFELSIDGILWLLTVKLALWILSGILSIAFFLLGLVFCLFYSIFSFPFTLVAKINEK